MRRTKQASPVVKQSNGIGLKYRGSRARMFESALRDHI